MVYVATSEVTTEDGHTDLFPNSPGMFAFLLNSNTKQ